MSTPAVVPSMLRVGHYLRSAHDALRASTIKLQPRSGRSCVHALAPYWYKDAAASAAASGSSNRSPWPLQPSPKLALRSMVVTLLLTWDAYGRLLTVRLALAVCTHAPDMQGSTCGTGHCRKVGGTPAPSAFGTNCCRQDGSLRRGHNARCYPLDVTASFPPNLPSP